MQMLAVNGKVSIAVTVYIWILQTEKSTEKVSQNHDFAGILDLCPIGEIYFIRCFDPYDMVSL